MELSIAVQLPFQVNARQRSDRVLLIDDVVRAAVEDIARIISGARDCVWCGEVSEVLHPPMFVPFGGTTGFFAKPASRRVRARAGIGRESREPSALW